METKTVVKLANIAGRLDGASAFVNDDTAHLLLTVANEIFDAIREDLPYSLKEGEV